jgi:serine/threonine protein phosphatase PrpC
LSPDHDTVSGLSAILKHRVALRLVPSAFGQTDIGRNRPTNEDSCLVRPDLGLFAVLDGAGGHRSGEIASALAARSLENYFGATVRKTHDAAEDDRFGIPAGARRLSAAIQKANRDVMEIAARTPEHKGMGTTVVALTFSPRSRRVHVGHVGDSRCYRLRGEHLELLTLDHSIARDVLEQRPELDDALLDRIPQNVVTQALGLTPKLRVDLRTHAAVPGDRFLLCSDGLSTTVEEEAIGDALRARRPPHETVAELITQANEAGGHDNIGVVVVEFEEGPNTEHPAPRAPLRGDSGMRSEPELLILGIEELDVAGVNSASDEILGAIQILLEKGS